MYFVTYFVDVNEYVVIPKIWIENSEINFERFVKNGLSKRKYLCYWSINPEAGDANGKPEIWSMPNFDVGLKYVYPCTEGCFVGRFEYFHGRYIENLKEENRNVAGDDTIEFIGGPFPQPARTKLPEGFIKYENDAFSGNRIFRQVKEEALIFFLFFPSLLTVFFLID